MDRKKIWNVLKNENIIILINKKNMLKVWGFAELKPEQKIIEDKIFDIVKKNYQKFWYTPIETPAVERTEVLTAKWWWEVWNQIFGVYWLAQGADDLKKYSLHFDLTVPFARYVLDYRWELTFPFKRSQIQKVWRWERQQRGRSREFYQADADVIWEEQEGKDYLFYDSEVIRMCFKTYLEIFEAFNLDLKIKININNKKIISWFISALWLWEKFSEISVIIDNKEKISSEDFEQKLSEIVEMFGKNILNNEEKNDSDNNEMFLPNISIEEITKKIIDFTNFEATFENIDEILNLVDNNKEELGKWVSELKTVLKNAYLLWINKEDIKINLWIIRGLDYYTGTIFETFIDWDRKLWSIASGGRYEWLTKYLDKKSNYSGVGFSMWITRFEDYLFEKLDMQNSAKTTSEYLVVNFEDTLEESLKLFNKLLESWKKVEFYPEPDKLKKQFRYADNKKIKYCILLGLGELDKNIYTLKNLETGESEEISL